MGKPAPGNGRFWNSSGRIWRLEAFRTPVGREKAGAANPGCSANGCSCRGPDGRTLCACGFCLSCCPGSTSLRQPDAPPYRVTAPRRRRVFPSGPPQSAAVCQAAAAMQRAGQPSTGGKGRPSPEKSDFRPGRTAYVPAVDSRQWTELFSALWNPPTTSGSSAIVPAAAFVPPIRLERRKTRVDRFGRSLLPNENAQFRRAGFHRLWGKFFVPAALLFCPGGAAGLFFIA